jgi:tRNA(fMet)-specific endonuclease VapC
MATSPTTRFLLDTNILVHWARGKQLGQWIENKYQLQSSPTLPLISEVTVGELYSFAFCNHWGEKQLKELKRIIDTCVVVPLNFAGVHLAYAQLDYFSRKPRPGLSSRKMGKNDLWIAATTQVTKTTLLTCDQDFDHFPLHRLKVEYVDPDVIKKSGTP